MNDLDPDIFASNKSLSKVSLLFSIFLSLLSASIPLYMFSKLSYSNMNGYELCLSHNSTVMLNCTKMLNLCWVKIDCWSLIGPIIFIVRYYSYCSFKWYQPADTKIVTNVFLRHLFKLYWLLSVSVCILLTYFRKRFCVTSNSKIE